MRSKCRFVGKCKEAGSLLVTRVSWIHNSFESLCFKVMRFDIQLMQGENLPTMA